MAESVRTMASFCAATFVLVAGVGFVALAIYWVADKLDVADAFDDDHNYYRRM